jgi:hypothetical protein
MEQSQGVGGIRTRAVTLLAWSLVTATLALVAVGLVLGLANRPEGALYEPWLTLTLNGPTFATLGALIVPRYPRNVIGWIFLGFGLGLGIQLFSGQYATVALPSQTLPGGAVAAWLSTLVQVSVLLSLLFLVLLFPTGKLLSPRWRPVAWIAGTAIVVTAISFALSPGLMTEGFVPIPNPFGVEAAAAVLDILGGIGGWTALACFVAAILSLILRFYRSRGDERLQLKWFVYTATLGFLLIMVFPVTPPQILGTTAWKILGTLVWTVVPLSLPVSAGIAILKYRLYDIDIIINRTLVYATLTVILAVLFESTIVVLQYLLRELTNQESEVAVVVSTLAIAATFEPLRRRIQDVVDRSFYRRKYDGRKTLEAFSSRLRKETDLDALNDELVRVVRDTMQPAHSSLWLRPDRPKGKGDEPVHMSDLKSD